MATLNQFFGNTAGKKGLSRTHCTIKEQIMVVRIEIFDKVAACPDRVPETGQVFTVIVFIG